MPSASSDFGWLVDHSMEVSQKYRGKWIAVHDGKVIGVGDTAVEADAKAREQCPDGNFVLEAIDHDTDVIYHAGL